MIDVLLTLQAFGTFSSVFIADFEQVNVCWGRPSKRFKALKKTEQYMTNIYADL